MTQTDKSSVVIRGNAILRWVAPVLAAAFAVQLIWNIRQALLYPSIDRIIFLQIGMNCLLVGWMLYPAVFAWTLKLRLEPAHLVLRTIFYPPYRSFRIAYADIEKVELVLKGYAYQIVTARDGILCFAGFELDGGPSRALRELARRIPEEKFTEKALADARRTPHLLSAAHIMLWFGFPLIMALMPTGSGRIPSMIPMAWKGMGLQNGLLSVESAVADPDGSIWVLNDLYIDDYHVRHVTDQGTSDWSFPKEYYSFEHIGVARDDAGNPWVFDIHSIYRWDGMAWQIQAYPEECVALGYFSIRGSLIWAVDRSPEARRIVRMDIGSGALEHQFLDLPEEALGMNSPADWIQPGPGGSLTVYISGDFANAFYTWDDGTWTKIAELDVERAPDWPFLIDLDEEGNLYVIQGPREKDSRPILGVFRPEQSAWTWSGLYFMDETMVGYLRIEDLVVDSFGRVWVTVRKPGNNYPDEFIGVFQETDGKFQEVRHYTEDNAGFSGGCLLEGYDGRIWAIGDYPAWIDSRQQNIPQPLPEWLSFLIGRAGVNYRFAVQMGILLLTVLSPFLILRYRAVKSKG